MAKKRSVHAVHEHFEPVFNAGSCRMRVFQQPASSMKTRNRASRGGEAMDPEKIMSGISKEILTAITAMEKAKTPEEKLMCSETIKNLCDSLGVFLSVISDMAPYDDDDESIPF